MAALHSNFSMPISILLAEANTSYREITRKMLRFYDANFVVDTCGSARECVEKAASGSYDLILADENIVYAEDFDLLEHLQRRRINMPVLVLFEEGHEENAIHALHRGAREYVIKSRGYLTSLPFTVKRLLEKQRQARAAESVQEMRQSAPPRQALATFQLNHRGQFMTADSGMVELCGYSMDELAELTLIDLLPKGKEWELFEWLQQVESRGLTEPLTTEMVAKYGNMVSVRVKLTPVRGEGEQIVGYRGEMDEIREHPRAASTQYGSFDSVRLIESVWKLMHSSRHESIPQFLNKMAKLSCQLFRFQRATVALLDRSKQTYLKVAMIGYAFPPESERRKLEVPKEVIDRIFSDRYRIKVLYYSQDKSYAGTLPTPVIPDRRSERRRPPEQWHPRDVVLIHLADQALNSFGYISLDNPVEGFYPSRSFFHELETFSMLASMATENHAFVQKQQQRTRRLTQVLVTSNIFKLYFHMRELLREVVWSVKFSLDFRLVALLLLNQNTDRAEVQAVACDDKVKAQLLANVSLSREEFLSLFDPREKKNKSYFSHKKKALQPIKEIYYDGEQLRRGAKDWPINAALIVPLKSRKNKLIGALLVDDPADLSIPESDTLRTLEILANQVSVAIENRMMYIAAKRKIQEKNSEMIGHAAAQESGEQPGENSSRSANESSQAIPAEDDSFWFRAFPRLRKYF